jgi:hypothetical protein
VQRMVFRAGYALPVFTHFWVADHHYCTNVRMNSVARSIWRSHRHKVTRLLVETSLAFFGLPTYWYWLHKRYLNVLPLLWFSRIISKWGISSPTTFYGPVFSAALRQQTVDSMWEGWKALKSQSLKNRKKSNNSSLCRS